MDTQALFARRRALAKQERHLLKDLRATIPDAWARRPIEDSLREGFRVERLQRRGNFSPADYDALGYLSPEQ